MRQARAWRRLYRRRQLPTTNYLRSFTNEVGSVVRAPHAFVLRDLWIWAQRSCHVHAVVRDARRLETVGRRPGLTPALERGHPIDLIRPGAVAAVLHAGRHEQADPVVLFAAHLRLHALVVVDGVAGRD